MYELINLLLPSSFSSFLLLLFSLCYQLQRAETCTNCINRAVASEGRGGGGGKGAAALRGPVEPDKSKSVNRFVFLRLSYFDYSDL